MESSPLSARLWWCQRYWYFRSGAGVWFRSGTWTHQEWADVWLRATSAVLSVAEICPILCQLLTNQCYGVAVFFIRCVHHELINFTSYCQLILLHLGSSTGGGLSILVANIKIIWRQWAKSFSTGISYILIIFPGNTFLRRKSKVQSVQGIFY